jgi:uncharacterized membrane protein YhiD involved in acid resistance
MIAKPNLSAKEAGPRSRYLVCIASAVWTALVLPEKFGQTF